MERESEDPRTNVHLTTVFKGTAIPSWLAGLAVLAFILETLALLLLVIVGKGYMDALDKRIDQVTREVRIDQLHLQDLENVLIRSGKAERSDFAPWQGAAGQAQGDKDHGQ